MLSGQKIAVVIPAYNERRLLPRTLAGLPGYVDAAVVVDDASTDDTRAVAMASEAPCEVFVVRHGSNQGVGAAIVSGYRWCAELGFDVAVVMGADDQMHPDDMPALLLPILRDEADYVAGDRLAWPGGWRSFPPVRLGGVLALGAMTRWAIGVDVRDAQCGYTAIGKKALDSLDLGGLYPRYGFPNDLLSKVALAGLRIETRPVRPIYDTEVSSLRIPKVVLPLIRLTLRNRRAHTRTAGFSRASKADQDGSGASFKAKQRS